MFKPIPGLFHWRKVLYWVVLSLIVLASVRFYSAWYTAMFSSDNAIHILMAQDFRIPEDLYYWGQDRRGSFEPVVAYVLKEWLSQLGLEPSLFGILSIVQFSLIGIAFTTLSRFLRGWLTKLIFAVVWFLPPLWFHFSLLLAHPYYAQLHSWASVFGAFLS